MEDTSNIKPNEQPSKPKIEEQANPACFKNTVLYFCNFCDNTSIHGFKFLGQKGLHVLERLFWFAVICGAVFGASRLIYNTYSKWRSSPVVVTFAMTETPIWKIPFPAITICPELKANAFMFDYSGVYMKYKNEENITKEEKEYFDLFSIMCNEHMQFIDVNETQFISKKQRDLLVEAFASIDIDACKWLGKATTRCDKWFLHTMTSEGTCITFNMLNIHEFYKSPTNFSYMLSKDDLRNTSEWTLDEGYGLNADLNAYPRRTYVSGISGGFQIDLNVGDWNLDYACGDLQGFKVTLHHPAEDPDMDKHFKVPLNQAVVAAIEPRMITTAKELRNYDPENRMCFLPGEKILSTFKIYTQQSCLMECLANFTIVQCNCLPFYMDAYTTNKMICGAGSKKCLEQAKVEFLQQEVKYQLEHSKAKHADRCGCLPSCTSLQFDVETSQVNWDWRKQYSYFVDYHDPDGDWSIDRDHMSRLQVYYKSSQFMTCKRHEFYGIVDFLADCGGLLGLFCGFSIISSIEILYYLSLRLWANFCKFGWKFWCGSEELVAEEANKNVI